MDTFMSIKEDRSCHYKVVISTPRLCKHAGFTKQLPNAVEMLCEKVVKIETSPSTVHTTNKAVESHSRSEDEDRQKPTSRTVKKKRKKDPSSSPSLSN